MVDSIGKCKRLSRFVTNGKTVIVPVDDSLIFGPKEGLFDIQATVRSIIDSKPSAVLGFLRDLEMVAHFDLSVPFIFNLTASTTLNQHTRKVAISTVEFALKQGADCVACHINISSMYEQEMIKNLADISKECDSLGMPLLAIAYPRKEVNGRDYNYEDVKTNDIDSYTAMVAHAVRISDELGADIVKTNYTGSVESFSKVIKAANGKPVVIAGGPKIAIADSLKNADEAMQAGASGISFGRNVFNSDSIGSYIASVKQIVFEGKSWDYCLNNNF